jgi:hypothetical protein
MPLHRELVERRIAELKSRIAEGDVREGAIRVLLYAGMTRGAVDERGFEAIRRMRSIQDGMERPTLAEFKSMVREQYFMLLIDPESAFAALPELLPDPSLRRKTLAAVRGVLSAAGEISGEVAERLDRVARVLGIETRRPSPAPASMTA